MRDRRLAVPVQIPLTPQRRTRTRRTLVVAENYAGLEDGLPRGGRVEAVSVSVEERSAAVVASGGEHYRLAAAIGQRGEKLVRARDSQRLPRQPICGWGDRPLHRDGLQLGAGDALRPRR